MTGRFLAAEWRHLVMLNYPIDPAVLADRLPRGTELDDFAGVHMVSVVGFEFLRTRVLGLALPFHCNFPEVNLRFYVRRRGAPGEPHVGADGWKRGVVFLKEIVPRAAIAWVARAVYGEAYVAMPMRAEVGPEEPGGGGRRARYRWRRGGAWESVGASFVGEPAPLWPGSEAEFITEHYWGYAGGGDRPTVEYRVEHPPWRVWEAGDAELDGDMAALYGDAFAPFLAGPPRSAFVAEGSLIAVYRGRRIVASAP